MAYSFHAHGRKQLHSRPMQGWARQRRSFHGWARARQSFHGLGQDDTVQDYIDPSIALYGPVGSMVLPTAAPPDEYTPLDSPLPTTSTSYNPLAPVAQPWSTSTLLPPPLGPSSPLASNTSPAIARLNTLINNATSPYGLAVPTVSPLGISQNVLWVAGIGVVALMILGGGKKKGRR
jgi:hypothetical protein